MLEYRCRFGLFSVATESDSSEIAELLRSSVGKSFGSLLQKRPQANFFADENILGLNCAVIARNSSGQLCFLMEMRDYPVHIQGKSGRATYLKVLHTPAPLGKYVGFMEHAFVAARTFASRMGFAKDFYTVIDMNDHVMRAFFERNLPRIPKHLRQGDLETTFFSTDLGEDISGLPRPYVIQRATEEDIPRVASLMIARSLCWNYSTDIDPERLELLCSSKNGFSPSNISVLTANGIVVGCVAVWDQREYRQVWAHRYAPEDGVLSSLRNLFSGVTKMPRLPAPGERMELAFLSFFYLHPSHAAYATPLLRHALFTAKEKGASLAALGLSDMNTLARNITLRGYSYKSRVYRVVFAGSGGRGRSATFAPQPEIALL